MKRIVKSHNTEILKAGVEMTPPVPMSDISVARLLDDGMQALHREMKNLLTATAKGKLDPASARDLRDTIKLLFELQTREKDSLRDLTDEELKAQAQAALDEKT